MKSPLRLTWRRAVLLVVLLLPVGMICAYMYATRPAQLRRALERAAARFDGFELEAGSLAFSPLDGLSLRDVTLSLDGEAMGMPLGLDGELLHVQSAVVELNNWALLTGRVEPLAVRIDGAHVQIVRDVASGQLNWDPPGESRRWSSREIPNMPQITARDIDVRIVALDGKRNRIIEHMELEAVGEQHADEYVLSVRRSDSREEWGRIGWDRDTGDFTAGLGWTDLRAIFGLLPKEYADLEAKLHLAGRARLTNGRLAGGAIRAATIEFENLRGWLPVGHQEWELPPERRFTHITNASGRLEFEGEQASVRATALVNGAPADLAFASNVVMENPVDSPFTLDVTLQGIELPYVRDEAHAAFFADVPGPVRAFFDDYEPRTRISGRLHVKRGPGHEAAPEVAGHVDFEEGVCRYFRFPYEFRQCTGRLRIAPDGIHLENLRARHGSARVTVNGRLNNSHKWTGFDLAVEAQRVPLDKDLYDALPERFHERWDRVSPIGLCDLRVNVRRDEGSRESGPLEPVIDIEAELLSASLSIGDGRRLTHVQGGVSIDDDLTRIQELEGLLSDTPVRMSGSIDDSGASGAVTTLDVFASGMPIDRTARDDGGGAVFQFSGWGDVWGSVRRAGGESAGDHYVIHVREGDLTTGESGQPWSIDEAWFAQRSERLDILSLSGRQQEAWLSARGSIPAADSAAGGGLSLDLSAGALRMSDLAGQIPVGPWKDLCERLGLSGPGQVSLRLIPPGQSPDGRRTELTLQAGRMRPDVLPLDFDDVRARLIVYPDRCEVMEVQAGHGDASLRANGRVGWGENGRWSEFALDVDNAGVGSETVDAMPARLRDFLRRLGLDGQMSARFDRISYDEAAGGTWDFAGRIDLKQAQMSIGLPLDDMVGWIEGTGRIDASGEPSGSARFACESGTLAKRKVERWEGTLEVDAERSVIELRDLRGRLSGGEVSGFATIDHARSTYELSLTLYDVVLDRFLRRVDDPSLAGEGRLDGHLFLQGPLGDSRQRSGGGDLTIRGASLLRTPVLRSVAKQRREQGQAVSDALDLARVEFTLQGEVVHLVRAEIESRDLRLVGEGRWFLSSDTLDLTLVGAHPSNWPRVALLTRLVEELGREFAQYRVTGPAKSPQVSVEPLHNLTEPIRELLER